MNRIFTFILAFLSVVSAAEAQSFVQVGTGTTTPTTAFSAFAPVYRASNNSGTRSNRSNTLYLASELSAIPQGATITALAWEKANAGGTIPGNPLRLEIWMRNSNEQPPLATTTTWTSITSSHTLVYNNLDAVIPTVPGWLNFPLNTPFIYTGGGLEIATENQIGGAAPFATDRFDWFFTPGTGDFVIGVTGSTTFGATLNNTTNGGKNRSNIRIFYTLPVALDLQAQAVLSPVPPTAPSSMQTVTLGLFNNGTTAITSANIHYQLGNGPIVTESWSGNLLPTQTTNASFLAPVTLPAVGNVQLAVWVSNVNGLGADGNSANDTVRSSFCLAIPGGIYTVGGATADFSNLQAVANALNCGGILAPVQFLLASGNYTAALELFRIPGAMQANAVVFAPQTNQLGDVSISNDSTATVSETFILSGTQGVTFQRIRFVRSFLPNQANHIVHMRLGAAFNQLSECAFVDLVGNISANNRAVGMFTVNNNLVVNNQFEGFGHAVFAVGEGFDLNNQWLNNTFRNYLNDALFVQGQQGAVIKGNAFIDFQGTGTTVAACSLRAHRNVTVEGNRVLGAIPRYAFNLFDFDRHVSGPNRIVNNDVTGFTTNTITSATAIRQCYVITGFQNANASPVNVRDQFDFIHNTAYLGVNSGSTNTLQALLSISGGSDALPSIDTINILNNNLVAYPSVPGGIPAQFRIMNFNVAAPILVANSNHNNFYFQEVNNPLVRQNSPAIDYQTIALWDSLRGKDQQSISVNPLFVSPALGIPTSDTLNNKGMPTLVTTDLNGALRSATTPDIGAYEYDVPLVELAITNLLSPVSGCGITDSLVRVQVANLGVDTLKGFSLVLLLNGQSIQVKSFSDTLLPGTSRVLAFDAVLDFSLGGRYRIEVYPSLRVDINAANDTLRRTVVNERINQFPFTENFDALQNGIPAFDNGWTSSGGSYRWFVNNGRTSTNGTGPAFDARESLVGRYLYTEASNGSAGAEATVTSSCLQLGGLQQPMLEFFYHGHGLDCFQLFVEQQLPGGSWQTIDTLSGPTHQFSRQAWLRRRVLLSNTATALRFRAVRGLSFEGDWAIDDIRLAEWPQADVRVSGLEINAPSCDSSATLPVVIRVQNQGLTSITNLSVGVRVGSGTVNNVQLLRTLAAGATDTLQTALPLVFGNNAITAFTSLANDTDTRLDTLVSNRFLTGSIRQFPYLEQFDTPGNWHAGGINSSWQRASPAATVINQALSGNASWVTNATGLVNAEERSWLESPCFDFSQLVQPSLSFGLWYNTPATAGANLQYSTDNGQTWQLLGSPTSGPNWYTANSIPISNGQAVWTGVLNPTGWRVASLPLTFLAGQPSVKFRFQMFSPANAILGEGLAIDSFRIADVPGSLPLTVAITPESCSPIAHTVSATFSQAGSLQQAFLRYQVNGGAVVSVPMTLTAGQYVATIPAQAAGNRVSWFLQTISSAGTYRSMAQSYTDGFVNPRPLALAAAVGSQALADSRLAVNDTLFAGTGAAQLASGVAFSLQALRHQQINDLGLVLDKRTALQVFFAPATSLTSVPGDSTFELVGSFNDLAPSLPGSYTTLNLQKAIRLQANDAGFLYVLASIPDALRVVQQLAGPTVQSDSNLSVRSGSTSGLQAFSYTGIWALPDVRIVPSNPVDSVQWYAAASPNVVLGTSAFQLLPVGLTPAVYGLRFFGPGGCVQADTFSVIPTGTIDLGVERIVSPTNWSQVQTDPVTVQVVVRNFGTLPVARTQMRLFARGVQVQSFLLERNILPGDTSWVSFNPLALQAAAPSLQLCAATGLGDANTSNDSFCVVFLDPTSVANHALAGVRLYPNPSQQHSLLQWNDAGTEPVRISMRDALGRVVGRWELPAGSTQLELSATNWPAGLYLLRVETADRFAERRWLVQH
jgi:archaellum component FlaF (FlaF/FlaG flagellin family)